jgi:hypothetical protein
VIFALQKYSFWSCEAAVITALSTSSVSVPYLLDSLVAGPLLVIKFVKPTKIFSRPPNYHLLGQFLPSQAEADIGATGAGVLWKADATVGHELTGLDSLDRVLDQSAELLALFVGGRKDLLLFNPYNFAKQSRETL